MTCKFGPWLASIYLALKVPSQQLNDKLFTVPRLCKPYGLCSTPAFLAESGTFIYDQPAGSSLGTASLVGIPGQKHNIYMLSFCYWGETVLCVTSHGRKRACRNLHMPSSRLCLCFFPFQSAVSSYYIPIKNLSHEYNYMLNLVCLLEHI